MKPTEADLIEVENLVLRHWLIKTTEDDGFGPPDRVVRTLQYLIARARDHNKREQSRNRNGVYSRVLEWKKSAPAALDTE